MNHYMKKSYICLGIPIYLKDKVVFVLRYIVYDL